MVVNKGKLICRPTFSWAVLIVGCWLIAIINADSVVIHAQRETVENAAPGVVRRQGMSLESCARACAQETEISCKYFKYLNDSRICLLSATDNPKLNQMASETARASPDMGRSGKKTVSSWVTELEEKIDELEDQESDIENLKSAVSDIRDELKMLRRGRISEAHRNRASKEAQQQAYTQLTRKIVGLKVDGEKFKAAVHALSNMQRVLAKEIGGLKDEQKDVLLKVAELEKASGDLNTLTASLKATDSALQRELDSIKDGTNGLATKFSKLRDRINQEIANKQMPPGMVKLKHNQGALATALESMTDKVSSLMSRLPFLEKELRGTNQKVSNQAMYERELQSKLRVLYKNLLELKKSVHNLLDPRSAVNMERAKGVLKLKSDVSMLAEMDKGLKSELQDQREDMARLVKDVARVQLMAQNLKDKLTLVLTASRQFQQDIAILKDGQKNGLSVVEVAQMQKQVLVALNRLKTREAILMKQLNKYRASVKKVARQVSKTSSRKTHTHHVVIQLQHRLNRFEKQMQLLFDKTKALAVHMKKPHTVKGISKLLRSQAQTNSKVVDLLKQLQAMRKRVSILSVDLRETKKDAEDEKKEMAKEVQERMQEMKQRQKELRKMEMKEKADEAKALKQKERMMKRKIKLEKQRMQRKLRAEKNKWKMAQNRNKQLKMKNSKLKQGKLTKKRIKKKKGKKKTKKVKGRKKGKKGGKRPGEDTIVVSDNTLEAEQALEAVKSAAKARKKGRKARVKGKHKRKKKRKKKLRRKWKRKPKRKKKSKWKRKRKRKKKGRRKGKKRRKGRRRKGKGRRRKGKKKGKGRRKGKKGEVEKKVKEVNIKQKGGKKTTVIKEKEKPKKPGKGKKKKKRKLRRKGKKKKRKLRRKGKKKGRKKKGKKRTNKLKKNKQSKPKRRWRKDRNGRWFQEGSRKRKKKWGKHKKGRKRKGKMKKGNKRKGKKKGRKKKGKKRTNKLKKNKQSKPKRRWRKDRNGRWFQEGSRKRKKKWGKHKKGRKRKGKMKKGNKRKGKKKGRKKKGKKRTNKLKKNKQSKPKRRWRKDRNGRWFQEGSRKRKKKWGKHKKGRKRKGKMKKGNKRKGKKKGRKKKGKKRTNKLKKNKQSKPKRRWRKDRNGRWFQEGSRKRKKKWGKQKKGRKRKGKMKKGNKRKGKKKGRKKKGKKRTNKLKKNKQSKPKRRWRKDRNGRWFQEGSRKRKKKW